MKIRRKTLLKQVSVKKKYCHGSSLAESVYYGNYKSRDDFREKVYRHTLEVDIYRIYYEDLEKISNK